MYTSIFIMCVLSTIWKELEKTRLENREIVNLLQKVITNNKTESDHMITVIYNETMTATPDEITALKQNFEDGEEYEVSLDYDTDGFVNKITIQ